MILFKLLFENIVLLEIYFKNLSVDECLEVFSQAFEAFLRMLLSVKRYRNEEPLCN